MKRSNWFLICEWDFAIFGTIMAYGGAPFSINLWLLFMCIWMMKKTFEELKREGSQ